MHLCWWQILVYIFFFCVTSLLLVSRLPWPQKWVRKHSLFICFLMKRMVMFFFKCLAELTSGAIRAWHFLYEKVFIYKLNICSRCNTIQILYSWTSLGKIMSFKEFVIHLGVKYAVMKLLIIFLNYSYVFRMSMISLLLLSTVLIICVLSLSSSVYLKVYQFYRFIQRTNVCFYWLFLLSVHFLYNYNLSFIFLFIYLLLF